MVIGFTHPIVPNRNRVLSPFEPHLEIRILAELPEQKREHGVTLRFWKSNNSSCEA